MPTESLICNSCSAPLQVPASANFVTCNHCGTQLSINRNSDVAFTEQLDHIRETTDKLANQLEELNSHQRLEALDREWQTRQADFTMSLQHGRKFTPTSTAAIAGGVGAVAFGILWIVIAIAITSSAPNFGPFAVAKFVFPLFGLVFVSFAIFGSVKAYRMAKNLEAAQQDYQAEHRKLRNTGDASSRQTSWIRTRRQHQNNRMAAPDVN